MKAILGNPRCISEKFRKLNMKGNEYIISVICNHSVSLTEDTYNV